MALVTCPECGRENVSDSATACPVCGYDVKTHFERKKREEYELKRKDEENRRKEIKKQEFVKNIREPEEPRKSGFERACVWGCFLFAIFGIVIASTDPDDAVMGMLCAVVFGCLGVKSSIESERELERKQNEYELAKKDFEAYKVEILRQEIERQEREEIEKRLKQYEVDKLPKCPVCKSHNTKKITVTSRAVSVAAVGVASSKIGKQYECRACKHKW